MRILLGTFSLISVGICVSQFNNDFSGTWKLDPLHSEIGSLPSPPDPVLKVEQKGAVLVVSGAANESGPFKSLTYPLDATEKKQRVGDATLNTRTKWEGAALLVNTLVSGPQNYTVMERWTRTRDGSRLTVKRTVVRASGESESLLVYENPAMRAPDPPRETVRVASAAAAPVVAAPRGNPPPNDDFVVTQGTRILLSLVSSINTKHAAPGDRVYLRTNYPVIVGGRVVIPPGSYVNGTVAESQRPGKVKGKASLYLRFDSIILPNGVTRDFRSRVGSADAKVDPAEGKMSGDGTKGRDAVIVGGTAATGASIGGIAAQSAKGAGIGGAAGAAAGLIGVLSSRGADLVFPAGSTMEMVLDRDLRFTSAELGSR